AIARRSGRSREGVRAVVRRLDERAERPAFAPVRAGQDRLGELSRRALARGVEPGAVAQRAGVSSASVSGAALRRRARLIADLPPPPVDRAPLGTPAGDELLDRPGVRGPGETEPPTTLPEWLAWARALGQPDAAIERDRLLAMHHLRCRAARTALDPGAVRRIDEAERDLRWATQLKVRVLRTQARVLVQALESAAQRPAEAMGERAFDGGMRLLTRASGEALSRFDPTHGGRAAAAVTLAAGRAGVRWSVALAPVRTGGAARRLAPDAPAPVLDLELDPWQSWLGPPAGLAELIETLPARDRELLGLRHGLRHGLPPLGDAELGERLGLSRGHVARAERRALRSLVRARLRGHG
ncbi:MAG: sigma factor-like helix-turn-helix DNA-binding protein, partial [Planctomycetota bacterium]